VRDTGADLDEAKDAARAHAAQVGLPFFEDGAEPAQYEGYAAIAREVVEQLGEPPARMVVPLGNGALLIGIGRVLGRRTVGVVAKEAPVMALSVAAGEPVPCDRCATFADGIAVRVAIPLATAELVRLAIPLMRVSERAIARAVGAFAAVGLRAEGAAAAPLAALGQLERSDGPEVLLVTGRNIDDELLRRAVETPESFAD
jgi:threonine dehydratase